MAFEKAKLEKMKVNMVRLSVALANRQNGSDAGDVLLPKFPLSDLETFLQFNSALELNTEIETHMVSYKSNMQL